MKAYWKVQLRVKCGVLFDAPEHMPEEGQEWCVNTDHP